MLRFFPIRNYKLLCGNFIDMWSSKLSNQFNTFSLITLRVFRYSCLFSRLHKSMQTTISFIHRISCSLRHAVTLFRHVDPSKLQRFLQSLFLLHFLSSNMFYLSRVLSKRNANIIFLLKEIAKISK